MIIQRIGSTILALGLAAASWSELAHATPLMGAMHGQNIVRINNDRGGYVIHYALRLQKMKKAGTQVAFTGRCLSACTLYLALPKSQTCISPRASFSFHAAYGAGPRGNQLATTYMLNKYPGWVREWISSHGGLSRRLITMPFGFASNYLRMCGTATAQTDLRGLNKRS
jgi:hypothetical protein